LVNILILGQNTFLDSCVCCFLRESGFNTLLADCAVNLCDVINYFRPHVIIITSYDGSAVNLANSLKNQCNQQKIIILQLGSNDDIYSALNMDIDGHLLITSPHEEVIEDINAICAGEKRVSRKLIASLIRTLKNDLKAPGLNASKVKITPRELDVLSLMAKGKTNKEIGGILNISPNTVKYVISHLFAKFCANSRADVVYKAYYVLKRAKTSNA